MSDGHFRSLQPCNGQYPLQKSASKKVLHFEKSRLKIPLVMGWPPYFIRTQFHYLPIKSPVISYNRAKWLSHELQRRYHPSISKLDRCVVTQTGLSLTSQIHLFVWVIRYDRQVFNFRASVTMSKFKTLASKFCKMTN